MAINSFSGEYRFLSNFYMCDVCYKGIIYPSSEHAYQAAKTNSIDEKLEIALLCSPNEAKKKARSFKLIPEWDTEKMIIMFEICFLKFHQNNDLRIKLIATGKNLLIEGNTWGDTFWGMCNNKGFNYLGKTLMCVRRILLED